MTTIGLDLRTSCAHCGENIFLNAIVSSLWCHKCRKNTPFDAEMWRAILSAPATDGPRAELGSQHASHLVSKRPIMRIYTRADAACARCKGLLPLPESL